MTDINQQKNNFALSYSYYKSPQFVPRTWKNFASDFA